ncbi:MAG: PH domain-containing protein [Clostridiales Family XIII bacterium]|jgi:membrane protein YdbS with pleckstrin-like domain|nr:PH domain-containing protein [Clostridiales Family XIII bacterium]
MRAIPEGRLNKKITAVWRLSGILQTLIIGIIYFASGIPLAIFVGPKALFLGIAGGLTFLLLLLLVFIIPPIRYARWRYAVLDDEIDIYRGIIVRKRIIVPLVRVQYTDTSQGPFLRAMGLASVNVSTAAGDESIPGLLLDDADALRDRVAELAKQVHEDV